MNQAKVHIGMPITPDRTVHIRAGETLSQMSKRLGRSGTGGEDYDTHKVLDERWYMNGKPLETSPKNTILTDGDLIVGTPPVGSGRIAGNDVAHLSVAGRRSDALAFKSGQNLRAFLLAIDQKWMPTKSVPSWYVDGALVESDLSDVKLSNGMHICGVPVCSGNHRLAPWLTPPPNAGVARLLIPGRGPQTFSIFPNETVKDAALRLDGSFCTRKITNWYVDGEEVDPASTTLSDGMLMCGTPQTSHQEGCRPAWLKDDPHPEDHWITVCVAGDATRSARMTPSESLKDFLLRGAREWDAGFSGLALKVHEWMISSRLVTDPGTCILRPSTTITGIPRYGQPLPAWVDGRLGQKGTGQ